MASNIQSTRFLSLQPGERFVREYEVVNRPRRIILADILTFIFLLCFMIVPGLLYAMLVYLFRKSEKGYLVLTDRRVSYYGVTTNVFGTGHVLFQVNVNDVLGIDADYTASWGQESVVVKILTAWGDGFAAGAGRRRFLQRWMPGTMGKDVFEASRTLYASVDAIRTGKEAAR